MDTYFLDIIIEFLKEAVPLLLEIIPLSPVQNFIINLFVTYLLLLIKETFKPESD